MPRRKLNGAESAQGGGSESNVQEADQLSRSLNSANLNEVTSAHSTAAMEQERAGNIRVESVGKHEKETESSKYEEKCFDDASHLEWKVHPRTTPRKNLALQVRRQFRLPSTIHRHQRMQYRDEQ